MKTVVVGIDTPRAISVWSEDGLEDARVFMGPSLSVVRDVARAMADIRDRFSVTYAIIEEPYGVNLAGLSVEEAESRVSAVAKNARAVGYLEATASHLGWSADVVSAGVWRKHVGIRTRTREDAKTLAMRLAGKAAEETSAIQVSGPRGGARVDLCEAVCISMAAWVCCFGPTGAIGKWRSGGRFA